MTDCALNPVDLWNTLSWAISGRSDGQILGADSPKKELGSSLHTNEFLAEFASNLDSNVQVLVGTVRYRITFDFDNKHEFGEGGASVKITKLLRGDALALVSRQQVFYNTLSDDSGDTTSGRRDELDLIDENDPFAELIFTLLSRA